MTIFQIIDIAEIRYIRELRLLRKLSFQRNPIQEMSDYRLSILFRLQMLKNLDGIDVTANEKVRVVSVYRIDAFTFNRDFSECFFPSRTFRFTQRTCSTLLVT